MRPRRILMFCCVWVTRVGCMTLCSSLRFGRSTCPRHFVGSAHEAKECRCSQKIRKPFLFVKLTIPRTEPMYEMYSKSALPRVQPISMQEPPVSAPCASRVRTLISRATYALSEHSMCSVCVCHCRAPGYGSLPVRPLV